MKHLTTLKLIVNAMLIFNPLFVICQYTKLHDFNGTDGECAMGSVISDNTYLYGMTSGGIYSPLNNSFTDGNIFKIKIDGTGYVDLFDFSPTNGQYPLGSLNTDSTYLYGMTHDGGTNNVGVLFKIKTDGTNYTNLLNFDYTNGANPEGSLIRNGTFLYGTTYAGGAHNYGLIFKIKTDGTGYTNLFDFDSISGSRPVCKLITDGFYLYGTTTQGGINNFGTVFKIKPDGTNFSKLFDFNTASEGQHPSSSLVSDGVYLYGMTSGDNYFNNSVLFKVKTDGTNYTPLLYFGGANGLYPTGSLIIDGVYLYGMTYGDINSITGAVNNTGNIFKIKTDGTGYIQWADFSNASGRNPYGDLLLNGSFLYGMTTQGGTNNKGVIFKLNKNTLATGTSELENDNKSFIFYPNPANELLNVKLPVTANETPEIKIFDLLGRSIQHETLTLNNNRMQINVGGLKSGIYFIQVGSVIKKFIKE